MTYRLVDCDTWADAWFEALEPGGKLFFLYLLTNPRSTSCGAFEVTPRKMAFETGLDQEDIERWLGDWQPRVHWWPEHSIVWIRNFYRRQGNHNDKTRINAMRIAEALPIPVQREIQMAYPELGPPPDTRSIPDPYPVHQTSNIHEHEHEQQQPHPRVTPSAIVARNGHAPPCAFAEEVGAEKFAEMTAAFTRLSPQLDERWLRQTVSRVEAEGVSLPAPAVRQALRAAYLKAEDALGREGSGIKHPRAWVASEIRTELTSRSGP